MSNERKHNIPDVERRFIDMQITNVEVRAAENGENELIVEGVAAVVNQTATIGGWFDERIEAGAFDDVMQSEECVCAINHDPSLVMARNKKTMELFLTSEGHLGYRATFPDTEMGRHYHNSIKRGDIEKSSFAFTLARDGHSWSWGENGENDLRTITKIARLLDVSPVTYPAYSGTSSAARSMHESARSEAAQGAEKESDYKLELRKKQLSINKHKFSLR
jgi:HK97 family phage prohead protease